MVPAEVILSFTGRVLRPIADGLLFITKTQVHPSYFPYPLAPTLHALRVSLAYQTQAHRFNGPQGTKGVSWGGYIAGYLMMAWGGNVAAHLLLYLPPPALYSAQPYINYLVPHLVLTTLFATSFLPKSLLTTHAGLVDTILFPIDALLRANSVATGLALLTPGKVDPLLSSSPVTHLIIGAVSSAGGSIAASTVHAWAPNWSLNTPGFLTTGWLGSLDVWGGALVALIYSVSVAHSAFTPYILLLVPHLLPPSFPKHDLVDLIPPPLSSLGAKAVGALVFMILFGVRVYLVHWSSQSRSAAATAAKLQQVRRPLASSTGGGDTSSGGDMSQRPSIGAAAEAARQRKLPPLPPSGKE